MATPNNLSRFTITTNEDGYQIHIEDDAGGSLDLLATEEQIDLMVDALDDVLGEDGGGAEVEDDEEDDNA